MQVRVQGTAYALHDFVIYCRIFANGVLVGAASLSKGYDLHTQKIVSCRHLL